MSNSKTYGSGSALTFDELHNTFQEIVERELTRRAAQIAPNCELCFNKFIDSGVYYLLQRGASPRSVTEAQTLLRSFTVKALNLAESEGKSTLEIETLQTVIVEGMWCPPFCGGNDE